MTQRAIGVHNNVTSQAVSMMAAKVRRETGLDPSLGAEIERLARRLVS